jgi:two-component sensor histidine kinase
VIALSEDRVALVIGDVQGHSAEAATIMGQIRTGIRAYAVEGHPPDVVMSHANRLLIGLDTEAFATCCYVALDVEDGDAWVVRAGHPQPVPRTPDGGTLEVEAEGGPPLGVIADADFPMTNLGMTPGSVLALFTDGLVESSKLHLEEGVQRVRRVLASAGEAVARAGAAVALEAPAPVTGMWDRSLVESVVGQLVSNALKFGEGRPVEIAVRSEGGGAVLTVRDHGIGIPEADQRRIFERFERAVSERHYGGFGVGLWVARQAIEALGGHITVASRPGDGAEFRVELPLDAGPAPARP